MTAYLIALFFAGQVASSASDAVCIRGADGRVACGYQCLRGSDGRAACAQTPGGACMRGADGRVVCSATPVGPLWVQLTEPPVPSCTRVATGGVVCGFKCMRGADGGGACATTPDGACERGANGRVVCTTFDPTTRIWLGEQPQATCVRAANGSVACGYGCTRAPDGTARCSQHPFGICDHGANGRAVCFPDDPR